MALTERLSAMVAAFRDPGIVRRSAAPVLAQEGRYALLSSFYDGSWLRDPSMVALSRANRPLYRDTRLVWRHAAATIDVYAHFCYAGDLSTDGRPLSDGTRGAIPLDPQTGRQTTDDALLAAVAGLWSMWRWKQHKSLAPKTAAILGDCMVELVDDVGRGTVMPRHVWPGSVTDLDLNDVGDVRRYTIEYEVVRRESTAYGGRVEPDRFWFKKEVDGDAIRYYRNDEPAAFPGWGIPRAVEPNPYGFAPAVWFRHEIQTGQARGLGALDKTLTAALELNSILSNALDSQHRHFKAPVGVIGSSIGSRDRRGAAGAAATDEYANRTVADFQREARVAAETMDLLPLAAGGQFVSVPFDSAAAVALLSDVRDAILAENPEARYGQELLTMTTVTGPGVERALAPIVGRVKAARDNHDPQMVKLFQMAVAIAGQRLKDGAYPGAVVAARPDRYEPFRAFDLTSYGRGLLDMTIPDRPVVPETIRERVELAILQEQLETEFGMRAGGVPEDAIAATIGDREARRAEMAATFGVARAAPAAEDADAESAGNEGGPNAAGGDATPAPGR